MVTVIQRVAPGPFYLRSFLPSGVRRASHASLVALSTVLAAACTAGSADSPYFGKAQPPAGQVLRYISGSEPESLDPPMASGQPEARIMMALFDGLTEYDPKTAQPIPALAESWEPNEDNSVFTFHLREATWSDGSPITADDFVYSLRRGLAPALASRIAYMAYDISNAQAYNEAAVFARDRATGAFVMDPANPAERLTLPGDEAARAEALKAPAMAIAKEKEYMPVRAEDVGIEAVDARTLRFHMRQPVPFVPKLVSHQFFRPVPRKAVEQYGDAWTQPGQHRHERRVHDRDLAPVRPLDRREAEPDVLGRRVREARRASRSTRSKTSRR